MLKLNVNQEKQLTFDVEIGGVQTEQLDGFLRISIDKIEYGFPAVIGSKSVSVSLPPLKSVAARSLKEGKEVEVKLEIVADGNHLIAWEDTFRLVNPLTVEAKIVDKDFKERPKLKTKLVQEGSNGDTKQKVTIEKVEDDTPKKSFLSDEDALTERIVNKLAKKLGYGSDIVKEEKTSRPEENTQAIEEEKQKIVDTIMGKETKLVKEQKKKISINDVLNIDKEGVYAYMERAGTKTPSIQKIIYEQAEAAAKSSKPVNVLRQVVQILKKE
jgi:hypothetical protein